LLAAGARAQETGLGADFRQEKDHLKDRTELKTVIGCGETLFTGHPLHIAVGSLAPGNGVGMGLAFVTHWTPNESWRLNWDADGVVTTNGSWRAGGYMTVVYTRKRQIIVSPGGSGNSSNLAVQEYPVFHLYTQGTSLEKISYFGIGPDTKESARSYFGMQQTVIGANAVWPVFRKLNLSLLGEANGRFVNVRSSLNQASPSIEQLYTEATAPGLRQQSAFAQFGEGVRLRPQLACARARFAVRLYSLNRNRGRLAFSCGWVRNAKSHRVSQKTPAATDAPSSAGRAAHNTCYWKAPRRTMRALQSVPCRCP
jgi:hypothetical protein